MEYLPVLDDILPRVPGSASVKMYLKLFGSGRPLTRREYEALTAELADLAKGSEQQPSQQPTRSRRSRSRSRERSKRKRPGDSPSRSTRDREKDRRREKDDRRRRSTSKSRSRSPRRRADKAASPDRSASKKPKQVRNCWCGAD